MRLKPLLTRAWSPLELRRLNPYRGRLYELLYPFPRVMVNPFATLYPYSYSCSTTCAIAGRLPRYCAFFSNNCWNKPQVLCAGYNPSFIGQLLHASKSAQYTFSLSNQVIYASSRCLLVRSFRKLCIKQTLLRYYIRV